VRLRLLCYTLCFAWWVYFILSFLIKLCEYFLREAQSDGACSVKAFPLTNRIAEKTNWGRAYANGLVVVAEVLNVSIQRDVAAGGRRLPSGNLYFAKRTLVG
jgi:hypothetical protein